MKELKEVLESTGLTAQRGIYTDKDKPKAYCTFIRLLREPIANADDIESENKDMYRITLFHKGDFEKQLDNILQALEAADFYINSVDTEHYETDTGYWMIPITIEILKE